MLAPRDATPSPITRPTSWVADSNLRVALLGFMRVRTKGSPDAEDLVQDVLLRIWNRTDSGPIDSRTAYAFQCAASVLADRSRRQRTRQLLNHVEFDAERHAACDADGGRALEDRQELLAVATALDGLPPRTRTVFLLRRLEGVAYRDIAARLGVSVSSVEKHMVRAVRKLAVNLQPVCHQ